MTFEAPATRIRIQIVAWCLIALGGSVPAYSAPQSAVEAFQRHVKQRFAKDQATRIAMEKAAPHANKDKPFGEKDHLKHQRLAQRAIDVDAGNVKWLKKHVSKFGLPAPSLIGADTAERMFVLLIHADRDRKFQQECVELMEASPTEWPAKYPERLKTRLEFTAPLKLKQTEELEQPKSPAGEEQDQPQEEQDSLSNDSPTPPTG